MALTLDGLRAFGADVDDGLARCMNNEAFYLRLVGIVKGEKNFDALFSAFDEEPCDVEAAFKAAHALKGVLGNLSLSPLFDPMSQLTELLRGKASAADIDREACDALLATIKENFAAFLALDGE